MGAGTGFTVFISNENMNDIIIKILKSLKDSNVLVDGITETFSTISRFISTTSNFFSTKRYKWKRGLNGREVRRAGRRCVDKML